MVKFKPRVPCDNCGVDVYGDDDAHILVMPEVAPGVTWAFCAGCWPDAETEILHKLADLQVRSRARGWPVGR